MIEKVNGSIYGMLIKAKLNGSNTSKSKNVDYLNFVEFDGQGQNPNYAKAYALGTFINTRFMGLVLPQIFVTEESEIGDDN